MVMEEAKREESENASASLEVSLKVPTLEAPLKSPVDVGVPDAETPTRMVEPLTLAAENFVTAPPKERVERGDRLLDGEGLDCRRGGRQGCASEETEAKPRRW